MTIYILDNDPTETAKAIDDKSLDKMIRSIAQVLCNVHWLDENNDVETYDYPADIKWPVELASPADCKCKWTHWARECGANYNYLVELGFSLYTESVYRHGITKFNAKYRDIIRWCFDNFPDLPKFPIQVKEGGEVELRYFDDLIVCRSDEYSPLPLVMPKKYIAHLPWSCDGCEYGEDLPHDCDVAGEVRIIESYRNYYKAKLIIRKKHYDCPDESNCGKCKRNYPEWTRRQKPKWLTL